MGLAVLQEFTAQSGRALSLLWLCKFLQVIDHVLHQALPHTPLVFVWGEQGLASYLGAPGPHGCPGVPARLVLPL
jgi:hypothetical protein